MKKPVVVSLFSGAGGLDLGLRQAGYRVRVQIDVDKDCYETLLLNKRRFWPGKIIKDKVENWPGKRLLEAGGIRRGGVALVAGGPPCQPFSKSAFWSPRRWADNKHKRPSPNKSRSAELFKGLEDPRAALLGEYAKRVKEIEPAAYLMENVFGLAYKTSRPMFSAVRKGLEQSGYTFNAAVLSAADYGVPQKRERLFIIGARDGVKLTFPEPTHYNPDKFDTPPDSRDPYVTAGDRIGNLDDGIVRDAEKIGGKWGHLLPKIPPGENYLYLTAERGHPNPVFKWRSKYWSFLLKLSPDKPSWTIQAQPGPYVGPFHWRNRRLRVGEIKRLQTFPDNYKIPDNTRTAQRLLGDAVPCLLAQKLGKSIKQQLADAGLLS